MNIPGITNIDFDAKNTATGKQTLGQEDFMNLLLKELSYQDPLNPMDSKEFTVQMTQFSSLEGINDINKNLNNLLAYQQSMQNATVTNMIGKTVTVQGNSSYLNGIAGMSYDLADDAASVKIIISDASGKVVHAEELGSQEAGGNQYLWDGKDNQGNQLPEGYYAFEIQAQDSAGNPVESETNSSGHVTGVAFRDGLTYLVLNGTRQVYLSDIKSIEE